jgi:colanic acid/amylovoran biosynthesis glycosyltransferase
MRNGAPPGRIAYIMSRFPDLTETFVLYEILEMERLGVAVEIYPLLRKRQRVVHPEAVALSQRAHYHPFLSLPILYAQWYFMRRRPLSYFKVLAEVLKGTFGSADFFIKALAIFPKAVRFAYEIEGQAIAHVHAQFATHAAVAALVVHRLTGIPFSFTARGADIQVDRQMLKEKLEAAAFAISVSRFNKELMLKEGGPHLHRKIHVIYGGVDTEAFSPALQKSPAGPFRILCVATLEEGKGHACLVEACRLLRDRGVDFTCHLLGDGPLRSRIEKQIARADLNACIKLHGACTQAEVKQQLAQASVGVLATVPTANGRCEGIPNVLKEAMACGLPVVASRIAGIPELVEHEVSGLLIPPGDAAALARAIERLKDDTALRRVLGQAGREKIVRNFNLAVSTRKRAALFLRAEKAEEMPWGNPAWQR